MKKLLMIAALALSLVLSICAQENGAKHPNKEEP
jgi:protein involved in sex pheromone biosynthesis